MSAGVAAVLGALIQGASPKPLALIMSDAEVEARVTTGSVVQRQVLKDLITNELVPLFNELKAAPYNLSLGALVNIQRDPALVVWPQPDCNSMPGSSHTRWDYKLGVDFNDRGRAIDIRAAAAILSDFMNPPGQTWSFPTTRDEATAQYLGLIALKGYFLRMMAASDAAREAGVPLEDALALYRREGDLVVPLPLSHFADLNADLPVPKAAATRLPPIERRFNVTFANWPLELKTNLKNGLWRQKTKTLLVFAADREAAKVEAFFDWCILAVGFDYLRVNFSTPSEYLKFSHMLRAQNAIAGSTEAIRKAKWEGLLGTLKLGPLDLMFIMGPTNSAALVSYILAEALLFMKLAGKAEVNGPFIQPEPRLSYLAHHTSDTRHAGDPVKDKFSWILASAAVALAKKAAAPAYCPLAYAKVRALGLQTTKLPDIPPGSKVGSAEHGTTATAIRGGLTSPAEKTQFADFILRAESGDWGAFKTHRTNCALYERSRAYYKAAIGP